ncbi:ATP-NAD kinase-like domain-containing protein [Tuber borchii]|uniref:ATP-NAD kinase-like domain-containing protein n=1 Tax=Tuber borchii TaxID=42251 RepID=A0A2T6ZGC3_TUBBO|nr:ATP-NAD kinase-like domain-containing protein [Tuber borchii]
MVEGNPSTGTRATNTGTAAITACTRTPSAPQTFSPPPSTTLATNNPVPNPILKTPTLLHLADDLPAPSSPKQHKQPQSPSKPSFFLKSPTSFSTHRNSILSVESVPRQTLLKALASRRPSLDPAKLTASLDNVMTSPFPRSASYSPLLNEEGNFTEYHDAMESISSAPDTAKLLPALQSPCFYHQRFDNAVNVERVLEEITGDEYTSHSRLVQTALGVREVARQLQRRNCKMNVKNIMIVTKARDNQLVNLTRELAHWIMKTPRYGSKLGVNVYVDKKLKESKRFDAAGLLREEPKFKDMLRYWTPDLCWSSPETFDLVLTLGGDGTVLFTSWLFQRVVPPILSFSLGSLGFLTNFQFESYKEHLNKVLTEGMRVNMRMRFTCTVYRDEGNGQMSEGDQFEVLNELVIDRGPSPYVSNLELYGDDDLLTVVQADGCIFSTPTGSTAYSLSAGGSLVHPDIPAILLTPICPHTLSFRPMLLNDSMLLRISVPKSSRATAWCAFDGKGRVELKQGDHVTIAASQYPFPTVLSAPNEWIDSVSRTLRWNTRAAQQKAWEGDSTSSDGPNLVEEWDIDTDSGVYDSDSDETGKSSPLRRQMSLLNFA